MIDAAFTKTNLEDKVRECRILMADDRIAAVSLVENILNRFGYRQLKSVTDSRKIFGTIDEWKPDLLILDVAIPYIDGFQVIERLRNQVRREDWIPILVVTADPDPEVRRKVLATGSTEFLLKPFEFSELLIRIRSLLMMYVLQAELRNQNQVLEYKVWARTRALTQRTGELETALNELKKTQTQVIQHERLRAFQEMAGGIAHDFNNILMCVVGYTDLLLQNEKMLEDKETSKRLLQTINTAGHDASQIVARLKEFYRPREQTEVFAPIDLNKLVKTVIHLTQPKWKSQALAKGCKVEMQLDLNKVPTVSGNAAELREAAINLVFNATDAMPEGGTIRIRTFSDGESVVLEISDTGIGMTEEVRQRCMEPFFSTKGENGTGLGLSMVFGIIKRHEGMIEIESEMGKGSTFRMTLPSQGHGRQMEDLLVPKITCSLHVLVVDDDPVPLDIIARYLISDGHTVVTACNASEALEKFSAETMDLVISDHAMPGMTGLQLSLALKQLYPALPVFLVTGFSDPSLSPGELPAGVDIVMEKPLSHAELRRALNTVATSREEPEEPREFMIGE